MAIAAQVGGSGRLNQVTEVLIQRLEEKGLRATEIPGFIRSVMIVIADNPPMSLEEINRRLHAIGWDSFEIDYHTLQLITASLEAEGLIGAEKKAVQPFKEKCE
jgi:hypothetical protein